MARRSRPLSKRTARAHLARGAAATAMDLLPSVELASHQAAGGSMSDLALADWNPIAASADANLLPDLQTLTAVPPGAPQQHAVQPVQLDRAGLRVGIRSRLN